MLVETLPSAGGSTMTPMASFSTSVSAVSRCTNILRRVLRPVVRSSSPMLGKRLFISPSTISSCTMRPPPSGLSVRRWDLRSLMSSAVMGIGLHRHEAEGDGVEVAVELGGDVLDRPRVDGSAVAAAPGRGERAGAAVVGGHDQGECVAGLFLAGQQR